MPNDIELTLSTPEALFTAPGPDPLAPGFSYMSGMDRILAETSFRSTSRLRDTRLVVLHADALPEALAA